MFEYRENKTLSAANLCPAVCISDVTNKAMVCVKIVKYVTSHLFSALTC